MALIYYTHFAKPMDFTRRLAIRDLVLAKDTAQKMIAVTPKPMDIGGGPADIYFENVVMPYHPERGIVDLYARIIEGCQRVPKDEVCFLTEDDVFYSYSHYLQENVKPGTWHYNLNFFYMCNKGFFERHNRCCPALSMAFGTAETLIAGANKKINEIKADKFSCFEPVGKDYPSASVRDRAPSIDIRGVNNTTWKPGPEDKFYALDEYWKKHVDLWNEYGIGDVDYD